METKQRELNQFIEDNKDMVDLLLQDFQKMQRRLYNDRKRS